MTSCGLFVPFLLALWICGAYIKDVVEVINMTLNILFFSVTIKKRKINLEEAAQQEMVERLYQEYRDRQISMYHLF
jgi:uncharacterized protein (TIGR02413 family)